MPRRPDAVHVYGVDLMSTGDLLKYFADYGARCWQGSHGSSASL